MKTISFASRLDQQKVDRRLERDPGNSALSALLCTKEGAKARFAHFDRITNKSPRPSGAAVPRAANQ